jgi:hypothetical protein
LDRAAEAKLPQVQIDWPSDTGLTLLGYTLISPLRDGQTSDVTSYWRIDSLAETRSQFIFGPFLHLVSADGTLAVNVSAPGLPGYYYRRNFWLFSVARRANEYRSSGRRGFRAFQSEAGDKNEGNAQIKKASEPPARGSEAKIHYWCLDQRFASGLLAVSTKSQPRRSVDLPCSPYGPGCGSADDPCGATRPRSFT